MSKGVHTVKAIYVCANHLINSQLMQEEWYHPCLCPMASQGKRTSLSWSEWPDEWGAVTVNLGILGIHVPRKLHMVSQREMSNLAGRLQIASVNPSSPLPCSKQNTRLPRSTCRPPTIGDIPQEPHKHLPFCSLLLQALAVPSLFHLQVPAQLHHPTRRRSLLLSAARLFPPLPTILQSSAVLVQQHNITT